MPSLALCPDLWQLRYVTIGSVCMHKSALVCTVQCCLCCTPANIFPLHRQQVPLDRQSDAFNHCWCTKHHTKPKFAMVWYCMMSPLPPSSLTLVNCAFCICHVANLSVATASEAVCDAGLNRQLGRQFDPEHHHSWQHKQQQWPACGPPHHRQLRPRHLHCRSVIVRLIVRLIVHPLLHQQ